MLVSVRQVVPIFTPGTSSGLVSTLGIMLSWATLLMVTLVLVWQPPAPAPSIAA